MGEIVPLRRAGPPLTALDDLAEALGVAEGRAPDLANLGRLQRLRGGETTTTPGDELAIEVVVDLLWWIAFQKGER